MKVPSQCCGSIMEDNSSSPSQNHNGPLPGGANVAIANNKHQNSDNASSEGAKDQAPQYSMPGILHFIQHEWARFELDRSQWELDRAEFQVLNIITFNLLILIMIIRENAMTRIARGVDYVSTHFFLLFYDDYRSFFEFTRLSFRDLCLNF